MKTDIEYKDAIPMAETRYYAVDDNGNVLFYGNLNEDLAYHIGGWNEILHGQKPVQCYIKDGVDKELVEARRNWHKHFVNKKKRGDYTRKAKDTKPLSGFKAMRCNLMLCPLPPRQKRKIEKPRLHGLVDLNDICRQNVGV